MTFSWNFYKITNYEWKEETFFMRHSFSTYSFPSCTSITKLLLWALNFLLLLLLLLLLLPSLCHYPPNPSGQACNLQCIGRVAQYHFPRANPWKTRPYKPPSPVNWINLCVESAVVRLSLFLFQKLFMVVQTLLKTEFPCVHICTLLSLQGSCFHCRDKKGEFSWTKRVNYCENFFPRKVLFLGDFHGHFWMNSPGYFWWIFVDPFFNSKD